MRRCSNAEHLVLVADAPLTPDQVRAIRERAARGDSYRDIGYLAVLPAQVPAWLRRRGFAGASVARTV